MKTWTRVITESGIQYIHSSGARVYKYLPKAWHGAEWGVQLPGWNKGDGGFQSMKEAKEYVERSLVSK